MSEMTTRLLRNGLAGDERDFSTFIQRISPLLVAVARRNGSSLARRGIDPEDIVQDVWATCLMHLTKIADGAKRVTPVVVKYLSVAVRNRVKDLMLAAHHKQSYEAIPSGGLPAETLGIVTRMIAAERDGQVLATIDTLDPIDRNALILLSIEQVALDEAAQILGEDLGLDLARADGDPRPLGTRRQGGEHQRLR